MAVGEYGPSPLIYVVGLAGAGSLVIPHPTSGTEAYAQQQGAKTDTQPVDEIPQARTGQAAPDFGALSWFDRIHFSENPIALGSVASSQVRVLRIFSSYFVPRTLSSIVGANDDGISLTPPSSPPIVFAPQQELAFNFSISSEGPPNVAATYTFTFDTGAVVLPITGNRITTWWWEPDWSRPILERMEWRTDVQRAYDGTEQRIQLRDAPRKSYEFAFGAEGRARRRLENAIYGWGSRVWALPIWPDGEALQATLPPGSTVIPSSTESRDHAAGSLAVFLSGDGQDYEVLEVESVAADSVTLKVGTGREWPAGTRFYPARIARLEDSQGFSRFTGNLGYGTASFRLVEQVPRTEAAGETIFRGYPVMQYRPEWTADPRVDLQRKLAELDNLTGRITVDDESGVPDLIQSFRFGMVGRAEIEAYRRFVYARRGRLRALWVPTWVNDLTLANVIAPSATAIDVQAVDYVQQVAVGPHKRNVRIELTSGQVFYRQITGASSIDAETERLTIDAALGLTVQPGDVALLSFMALCRFDGDAIEIAWQTGDFATSAVNLRAPNHGL